MKKVIAIFSVVLMAGCALALADENSNAPADQAGQQAQQAAQPGQADQMNQPGTSAPDSNTSSQTTETTTTTQKDQAMRSSKSCVDTNGNTLKKGDVGFKDCMKSHMSKEQGGTAADSNMENPAATQ